MKLLSGVSKKLLFTGFAVAAIGLPLAASAETDVMAHAETAAALQCLLNNGRDGCAQVFVGSARLAARPWVGQNPRRDFALGPLVSSEYARTETEGDIYDRKLLNGRTADLYDVKFRKQEKTFYIARPEPDGKIRALLVRNGRSDPGDERLDLAVLGPH
jgi:hypothetical protein